MADRPAGTVVMRAVARTPLPWLAALLTAYLAVPVLAYLVRVATTPLSALTTPGLGAALWVSVETASISTGIIAVLGIPLGYLLSRGRRRASTVIGVAVQLPLALPPLMSGILLVYLVGPYTLLGQLFGGQLTDTRVGIVLAQTFVAAPFLIVAARSAFGALDPGLDDVAATLGHGRWSRFIRVAAPAAAPGIVAGLLLAWLRAFGEFGATVVLAYHPFSLPVFTYVQFGGTGITSTLSAVGASLVAAALVLAAAAGLPRIRRWHPVPHRLPAPTPPPASASPQLAFDVSGRLGSFRIQLAYATTTGRHLVILGPSGSGKSLTLRILAGLIRPTAGQVCLGDTDITALPPERRGVGYVPQDAALLPHLPVWKQVTFGVGTEPGLAAYWIVQLGLTGLEHRLPAQLSGGQRRRVAIARALARNPALLLLDEPFTGLDAPVRDELRHELRRLQRDTALTTVIVTHDPVEAALLADEVLIINAGRCEQAGPQPVVFAHPVSPTAARLLGIRNLRTGRLVEPGTLASGGVRIGFSPAAQRPAQPDGDLTWCIRPEHLRLERLDLERLQSDGSVSGDGSAGHSGTIRDIVSLGVVDEVLVALAGGLELTAQTAAGEHPGLGERCLLTLPPASVIVWPDRDIQACDCQARPLVFEHMFD
ncbi:MAG: ATP-binding cassette domain-containing protein [Pseudonocardiaceae bacterium]